MHIALYKPDIPQNTAAIIRLRACLNLKMHIIEPCGFNINDARFKRVVMDYFNHSQITRYQDYDMFIEKNKKRRIPTLPWAQGHWAPVCKPAFFTPSVVSPGAASSVRIAPSL